MFAAGATTETKVAIVMMGLAVASFFVQTLRDKRSGVRGEFEAIVGGLKVRMDANDQMIARQDKFIADLERKVEARDAKLVDLDRRLKDCETAKASLMGDA